LLVFRHEEISPTKNLFVSCFLDWSFSVIPCSLGFELLQNRIFDFELAEKKKVAVFPGYFIE
jgi:hypothetical protein